MRIKKFSQCLLGLGGISLFVLTFCLLNPVQFSPAHAEDAPIEGDDSGIVDNGQQISAQTSSRVATYVQSTVSVSLEPEVSMEVTPKSYGAFALASSKVVISSNNISGFSVYLQSKTDETALIHTDKTITDKITATTNGEDGNGVTQDNLGINQWGYNFGPGAVTVDSKYKGITATATNKAYSTTSIPENVGEYNLTFGVKAGGGLSSGEYANDVVLSVVANPMTVTSLNQLTYMQDMTSDICSNSAVGTKKQLVDARDGNKYWVEKLADNNCWMTQNLAISFKDFNDGQGMRAIASNGKAGAILTSDNTDLTTDADGNALTKWQGMEATEYKTTSLDGDSINYNATASWDLGKYVLADPTDRTKCVSGSDANISIQVGGTLANCVNVGFVNVSDGNVWDDNFEAAVLDANAGGWDGKTQLTAVRFNNPTEAAAGNYASGGSYDAHYLVGNYYTFNAMAAGTAGEITGEAAPSSICPHNWRAPLYNGANSDFKKLLSSYGINSTLSGTGSDGRSYNVASLPLAFVYGGDLDNWGRVANVGSDSWNWYANRGPSSVKQARAFIMGGQNMIYNGDIYSRSVGISIRCLAR